MSAQRKANFLFSRVFMVFAIAHLAHAQGLVSCKPISQKTSETGCWIVATQPVGVLAGPIYWTIDSFPAKELADHAREANATVVESLGKVWLFTIGKAIPPNPAAKRLAQIGPLPLTTAQAYEAQYMEATLQPGMVSRTHLHSGAEAFYTDSGETCLETPNGKKVGKRGVNIVIPEGVPMELSASGTETRRGLMLILHDASRPPTTLVDDWKSKGLCAHSF
jgi:quercetin dioxygenase-like cupin family protein